MLIKIILVFMNINLPCYLMESCRRDVLRGQQQCYEAACEGITFHIDMYNLFINLSWRYGVEKSATSTENSKRFCNIFDHNHFQQAGVQKNHFLPPCMFLVKFLSKNSRICVFFVILRTCYISNNPNLTLV
jgi:hypothetical protein